MSRAPYYVGVARLWAWATVLTAGLLANEALLARHGADPLFGLGSMVAVVSSCAAGFLASTMWTFAASALYEWTPIVFTAPSRIPVRPGGDARISAACQKCERPLIVAGGSAFQGTLRWAHGGIAWHRPRPVETVVRDGVPTARRRN